MQYIGCKLTSSSMVRTNIKGFMHSVTILVIYTIYLQHFYWFLLETNVKFYNYIYVAYQTIC